MSETTYNVIAPESGVPVKAWTKGVPLEDAARDATIDDFLADKGRNVGPKLGVVFGPAGRRVPVDVGLPQRWSSSPGKRRGRPRCADPLLRAAADVRRPGLRAKSC